MVEGCKEDMERGHDEGWVGNNISWKLENRLKARFWHEN